MLLIKCAHRTARLIVLLAIFPTLLSCGNQKNNSSSINADQEKYMRCVRRMHWLVAALYQPSLVEGGFLPLARVDGDTGERVNSWRYSVLVATGAIGFLDPPVTAPWPAKEYRTIDQDMRRRFSATDDPDKNGYTDFLALRGPGTAFDEFGVGKERCILDVEPDTILLVECNSNIHWIEPGDLELESVLSSRSETGLGDIEGNFPDGFAVAFADGAAWFLKNSVPFDDVAKFFTVDSAKQYDRDEVLGPYATEKTSPISINEILEFIGNSYIERGPCGTSNGAEE